MNNTFLKLFGVPTVEKRFTKKYLGDIMQPLRGEPPKRNGEDWLKTYNTSPRMAPVTKMSRDISTKRGNVYRKSRNGQLTLVPNHPLIKMLYEQPNNVYHTTGSADLYLSQVHFLVRGESFALIEKNKSGEPTFLWFLPPDWIKELPKKERNTYIVELKSSSNRIEVNEEDMFYRKNPDPLNPIGRGIGRVEQIGDELETDEYMAKFAKRFFFNDATPNIIVTAPDGTSDDNIENLEKRWVQKFGGLTNSNKAAFLNWEAKVHVLNSTNKEMDFIESRKFYRDLAMQHFGIPPEIMGNVENSNKATVVAARDIYINEVLEPQFVEFEEAITHQLLSLYKNSENLVFRFERKTIEDKEFELKRANEGLDRGGITINEYRIETGRQPLAADCEMGDALILPTKKQFYNIKTKQFITGAEDTEDPATDNIDDQSDDQQNTDDSNDTDPKDPNDDSNKNNQGGEGIDEKQGKQFKDQIIRIQL